jgi:kanamycin kinase
VAGVGSLTPSTADPTLPPLLATLAPDWSPALAYCLIPQVTTWRLTHPDGSVRFAKVDTAGAYPTLLAEAERMIWASAYLPVPRVVALEQSEGIMVLITEALLGRDGTDQAWRNDVVGLVMALGSGLRAFHDAIDEARCPFRFGLEVAREHVHTRVEAGTLNPARGHLEHQHLSAREALALLDKTAPSSEDLVVCHGDYCPPNALLTEGRVTGYVDLGELGVADRWWDLAIGGWSTVWNFGAQFEALFYTSYGIEPDHERIAFYRLLYDLVS